MRNLRKWEANGPRWPKRNWRTGIAIAQSRWKRLRSITGVEEQLFFLRPLCQNAERPHLLYINACLSRKSGPVFDCRIWLCYRIVDSPVAHKKTHKGVNLDSYAPSWHLSQRWRLYDVNMLLDDQLSLKIFYHSPFGTWSFRNIVLVPIQRYQLILKQNSSVNVKQLWISDTCIT